MNLLGTKLESVTTMVPGGGVVGALLPLLAMVGWVACIGEFGMPGLEKAIVAVGMFASGVLYSRVLPVWREARSGELERLAVLRDSGPAGVWFKMAKAIGWGKAIAIFLSICAVLAMIAVALPKF